MVVLEARFRADAPQPVPGIFEHAHARAQFPGVDMRRPTNLRPIALALVAVSVIAGVVTLIATGNGHWVLGFIILALIFIGG
jgi:hypothetical protein